MRLGRSVRDSARCVIGRTPPSSLSSQAVSSVARSTTVRNFADRAGDGVLAVGRDVSVVQAAVDRNALCKFSAAVSMISSAPGSGDRRPRSACRPWRPRCCSEAAQGNLLDELAALIDDVERAVGFVADVDPRAVRREAHAVRRFDALDHLDDLVGRGIDDVNVVAGGVRHVHARRFGCRRRLGYQRECRKEKDAKDDSDAFGMVDLLSSRLD